MSLIKSSRSPISNLMRVVHLAYKGEQSETVGSAGAIRQDGGAFGKLGAAKEAEYFYKEQVEQLKKLSRKGPPPYKSK
ncbi:uncharacterized protein LOC119082826 isoform X2 [Bradysia coprophila]|uniref:uncharacterized protein LOC119082826 isoform X2 n=1 Tax=Bradysia coprophila TaxID=38358 RepID=UPI00187DBF81|nr:uncharacterized protein LOC119082826 isoform X2 [Bradysia coprophila]